jgi:hypothetical protein
MSSTSTPSQVVVDAVVPHPQEPAVLMLPLGTKWTLPRLQSQHGDAEDGDVKWVNEACHVLLGARVSVLRQLVRHADRTARCLYYAYLFELHPSESMLPTGRWVGPHQLPTLHLAHEEQRAVLSAYFDDLVSAAVPDFRAPWARPGWLRTAQEWIRDELNWRGSRLTGRIEQVRTWALSCVLRAPTADGPYYFKVAAALPFSHMSRR